jgi:hypothetical protein
MKGQDNTRKNTQRPSIAQEIGWPHQNFVRPGLRVQREQGHDGKPCPATNNHAERECKIPVGGALHIHVHNRLAWKIASGIVNVRKQCAELAKYVTISITNLDSHFVNPSPVRMFEVLAVHTHQDFKDAQQTHATDAVVFWKASREISVVVGISHEVAKALARPSPRRTL